jgi:hypothetical protein
LNGAACELPNGSNAGAEAEAGAALLGAVMAKGSNGSAAAAAAAAGAAVLAAAGTGSDPKSINEVSCCAGGVVGAGGDVLLHTARAQLSN